MGINVSTRIVKTHTPHFTLKHKGIQPFSKAKNQNNQEKYSTNQMLRRNNQIQNIFPVQRVQLSHNNSRSSYSPISILLNCH
jgi:hypothetical protein